MATSLPDVFAHSAYQHIQMPRIKARARMQNAFYANGGHLYDGQVAREGTGRG